MYFIKITFRSKQKCRLAEHYCTFNHERQLLVAFLLRSSDGDKKNSKLEAYLKKTGDLCKKISTLTDHCSRGC